MILVELVCRISLHDRSNEPLRPLKFSCDVKRYITSRRWDLREFREKLLWQNIVVLTLIARTQSLRNEISKESSSWNRHPPSLVLIQFIFLGSGASSDLAMNWLAAALIPLGEMKHLNRTPHQGGLWGCGAGINCEGRDLSRPSAQ